MVFLHLQLDVLQSMLIFQLVQCMTSRVAPCRCFAANIKHVCKGSQHSFSSCEGACHHVCLCLSVTLSVCPCLIASEKLPPAIETGCKQWCRLQVLHRGQDRGLHSSGQADAQSWRSGQGAHISRASHTEGMDGCVRHASAGL